MTRLRIALVATAVALACTPTPKAPRRPFGVPKTAAWAGGADGGAWIDCWRVSDVLRAEEREAHADVQAHADMDAHFDCSIFAAEGAIAKRGRFTLDDVVDGGMRVTATPRRVMQYDAWDGVRILLSDGRVLVGE